jgi:thiaminase
VKPIAGMSAMANSYKAAKIVAHIHHEMGLHIDYCKDFGVTKEEIEMTEESQGMSVSLEMQRLTNHSQPVLRTPGN